MSSNRQSPFDAKESLSAVMDGASHELELQRVLAESASNAELRQRWSRYHLISAVIQKQPMARHDSLMFADAVRSAIDAQDHHKQSNRKLFSRVAVAASVALVVVVGAQWQQSNNPSASQQLATNIVTVERSASVPEQKALVGVPNSLGVANIFARSSDVRTMYSSVRTPVETASMKTDVAKMPFMKATGQNPVRK